MNHLGAITKYMLHYMYRYIYHSNYMARGFFYFFDGLSQSQQSTPFRRLSGWLTGLARWLVWLLLLLLQRATAQYAAVDCTTTLPAEYINSIIVGLVLKKWHNTSIRRHIKYSSRTYQEPPLLTVNRTIRHLSKAVCVLALDTVLLLDLIGIFSFFFVFSRILRRL